MIGRLQIRLKVKGRGSGLLWSRTTIQAPRLSLWRRKEETINRKEYCNPSHKSWLFLLPHHEIRHYSIAVVTPKKCFTITECSSRICQRNQYIEKCGKWYSVHSFIHRWLYSLLLGPGLFNSVIFFYTDGRISWTGDQPIARPLPTHRAAQTQNKCTENDPCLWVELKPTIPAFEKVKTVHAIDRAAPVAGILCIRFR
jgi:hypothetical protein